MTSASSAPAPAGGGPDGGPAPLAAPRGWLVFALFACLFLLAAPDRRGVSDPWAFPLGHSLGILPFAALGRLLESGLGWRLPTLVLLNGSSAVFAALAVMFVWKTLVEVFAVSARPALTAAALYGLGSALLPYSKLLFTEAQQSALIAALLYHILAPPRAATLPTLALIFALLVLTAPIALALLPVFLLGAWANGVLRVSTRQSVVRALVLSGLCVGVFLGEGYLATGNPTRVFDILHDPLSPSFLLESLRVWFVSPEKNLFVFNPVLGLAVAGFVLPMEGRRRWLLLGAFAAQLLVSGMFMSGSSHSVPGWGPRHALVLFPALVPFIAVLLGWVRAQPLGQRLVLWTLISAVGAASVYVQVLGASYDILGPRHVCESYEKLRIDGALPPCDGDDLSASILALHNYLLWRVTKQDLERGTTPELPWVTERFEPTLAQRVFTDPYARAAALDESWLFFGFSDLPAERVLQLQVARALLGLLAALFALRLWRFSAERPTPSPTPSTTTST